MRGALGFLTVLGRSAAPGPASLPWFPVVGVLLGLAVGLTWAGAEHVWPPLVAAAVVVAVDAVLTGGLHLDGLADSGDGLLPALLRDRRLAVMSDPRVGAFGVLCLATVLLLRWSALASAPVCVPVLAGLWCASRSLAAGAVLTQPYARAEGLASAFRAHRRKAPRTAVVVVLGLAISGPLCLLGGTAGAAALGAGLLGGAGVVAFARRRLGGYTGDVLGAAVVTTETVGLLVLAARW